MFSQFGSFLPKVSHQICIVLCDDTDDINTLVILGILPKCFRGISSISFAYDTNDMSKYTEISTDVYCLQCFCT